MSSPSAFRDDINGLRAWAVLAVVLFHFGVPGFVGGFVGVDVFFVISGYLMTGIITRGLERNNFSYLGFCMARAARILPALLVLCTVLLILGYFTLTPLDYRNLATHAFSSVTFIANFKYWDEAGYFDTASHEKWLLHTWSLSVEWQFYLLLPLLLMAVWARWRSRRAMLAATVLVLAASLGLNLWATIANPSLAFFLLPPRAWELLAGGVVFLWAERRITSANLSMRQGRALAGLGLLMIIGAVGLLDANSAWPGWRALAPVLGTAMVIAAAQQGFWLTCNPILRWTGERSYSIYLWHWPVYVASRYLGLSEQVSVVVVMAVVTALLAEASYRWAELPCRLILGRLSLRKSVGIAACATFAVATLALTIRTLDGVAGRLPAQAEWAAAKSEDSNPRNNCTLHRGLASPACHWGGDDTKPPSLAVVGDSHAVSILTAVAQTLPAGVGPAVQWTYSGCSFMLGSAPAPAHQQRYGSTYLCGPFQDWAADQIRHLPPTAPLLIVNRYAGHVFGGRGDRTRFIGSATQFDGATPATEAETIAAASEAIIRTACAFAPQRRVLLLRPIPEMPVDVPRTLARQIMMGLAPVVSVPRHLYEQRNAWVWKAQDEAARRCGAEILDPTPYLCDAQRCYGNRDGIVLYHDADHLSETGNKVLVGMFTQALARSTALRPAAGHVAGQNQ